MTSSPIRFIGNIVKAIFQIEIGDTPSRDVAGRLRTSEPFSTFQNKQVDSLDRFNWFQETVGGGTIVFAANEPIVELSVGTTIGDIALNQTARYFPYLAGLSNFIKGTMIFAVAQIGLLQQFAYGDDLNAMGIELRNNDLNFYITSSTSGTPVTTTIPRSEWDDPLDGSGPSGETLDITKLQFFTCEFLWLGAGPVKFGFYFPGGRRVWAHIFQGPANTGDTTYTATPTLPLRYRVENIAATANPTTFKQICCAIESEGGLIPFGARFSSPVEWANERTLVANVQTPITAIRLTNTFNGKPNRRTIRLLDSHFYAQDRDVIFQLFHIHPPNAVTATWIPLGNGVEYSTDITAVTGLFDHLIDGDILPAAVGSGGSGSSILDISGFDSHSFASQNINSDDSQIFVLCAEAKAATNVIGGLTALLS